MSTGFHEKDGVLHVDDVPLEQVADKVGTPAYCYSAGQLEENYTALDNALKSELGENGYTICFACKANSNLAVLSLFARLGAGADVVSLGEMLRAQRAGIAPAKTVFSGVGKSREEMERALTTGIMQINVESLPELEALSDVAQETGQRARIAIRINPDVDAHTHAKITTGKKENKFGIDIDLARDIYRKAAALPGIEATGIACHIGSQMTELAPFRDAFTRVAGLVAELREDGHDIRRIDIGGGLGIVYDAETPPDFKDYAALVKETLGGLGCHIVLEPGRALAGNAGVLLSRVHYIKQGSARHFVIIDAAMNDLARPSLYDAWHTIRPCAPRGGSEMTCDIVGPVCETGDTFATQRKLPELQPGDLVAIMSAGAYGAVMASTYNSRSLAPEVLVRGSEIFVVRRRITTENLLDYEDVPST